VELSAAFHRWPGSFNPAQEGGSKLI
jgi:hypothetical protein